MATTYGPVTQVTGHVAAAQGRLLTQYQQSPNLLGLVGLLAARAQVVENTLWQVLTLRTQPAASGQQLDNIGKIIGLARSAVPGGNVDAVYATWLRIQIAVNASSGTAPNLAAIVLADGDVGTVPQVLDQGLATVVVRIGGAPTSQPSALAAALQLARAAGVRLVMEYLSVPPATTFTWDGAAPQYWDAGFFANAI